MRQRKWHESDLVTAVHNCKSYRCVLKSLGLVPAGGNYEQVKSEISRLGLDATHFLGMGWNTGRTGGYMPKIPLSEILVENSSFQSYKLKRRLFKEGLKAEACEECGWAVKTADGYLPLELDHINGNRHDNRLINLRVLCPNCHSLKPTHRGRNTHR